MNFVGHLAVAVRCELDDDGRLGAMLPDLTPMLGRRLQRDRLPDAVLEGVELHHRTDAVFHGHTVVRDAMATLTASFESAGIARGSARALGHVGFEMLLDASASLDELPSALAAGDRREVAGVLGIEPGWTMLRRRFADNPPHYDDAGWVAERLFHILERRPRLRFDVDRIPAVESALAAVAPSVRSVAPQVFDDVTSALTASLLKRSGE